MMLSPQKYPNTSRTITGLINFVFTSDVLLFCDTSAGAVAVNLLEIPSGFWNTNYKLYVIDANNNAQTNNITINAPVGFQVNNASSFVISTNGGIALIRVTNNTDYSVETNYGAGGLAVLNEGVLLTPNATSMDFIGSYVNATSVGSAVSVLIQPTIISLTYAQLLTNIANSTLIAGQMYSISNAIFIQTTSETAPIYLTATSTNAISSSGQGYFLNADYQGTGNYSGVTGFVAQLGIWKGNLTPAIGDVVIWNNFHYKNISGNNTQPDLNPTDWTQLAKAPTNGYIVEICAIQYDVNNNFIIERSDLRENVIQNNINTYVTLGFECFQYFQWGSDDCKANNVNSEGAIKNSNNFGSTLGNFVSSGGAIKVQSGNTLAGITATIQENVVMEFSKLFIEEDVTTLNFSYNEIAEVSTITIDKLADPFIQGTIAVNKFSQSTLSLAPCSSLSTIYSNRFKGVIGSVVNDFGSFSFNEIVSSSSYTFTLANTGDNVNQAIFNENQIYYSDISIGNLGIIRENVIESSSITIDINQTTKSITLNSFTNYVLSILQNNSSFNSNKLFNSSFNALDINSTTLRNINGNLSITTLGNFTYDVGSGLIFDGITTTSVSLNLSDPAIYDAPTFTLTIPTELEFVCGVIFLINSTGAINIKKIVGGLNPQYGSMRFVNISGFNVTFDTQAIGLAVADEIISNLGATSYVIVDRVNGADSIYIRRLGTFNGVEQVYLYV